MITTIRKAEPEDWKIIQRLNREMYDDNKQYDPYLDLDEPYSVKGTKGYQESTRRTDNCVLIAEVDGEAIGYLVGERKEMSYRTNKIAEIDHMAVSPKFQSQGIGAKLVNEFKEWARNYGFTHIYVNAYAGNERAIVFYKKQGLVPIDVSLEGKL